jgi:hypothetical protein
VLFSIVETLRRGARLERQPLASGVRTIRATPPTEQSTMSTFRGTIGFVVAHLFPGGESESAIRMRETERQQIHALLSDVRARLNRPDDMKAKDFRLIVPKAQRAALLDAGEDGVFGAEVLERAMRNLDIDELVLELRSGNVEAS